MWTWSSQTFILKLNQVFCTWQNTISENVTGTCIIHHWFLPGLHFYSLRH